MPNIIWEESLRLINHIISSICAKANKVNEISLCVSGNLMAHRWMHSHCNVVAYTIQWFDLVHWIRVSQKYCLSYIRLFISHIDEQCSSNMKKKKNMKVAYHVKQESFNIIVKLFATQYKQLQFYWFQWKPKKNR